MNRPTYARIDLGALRSNIRTLRGRIVNGARIMAVVKADCYGHGVALCVPEMLAEGIDLFGIATVEEGAELRAIAPHARIVVLPAPPFGQQEAYAQHDLEAMISDATTAGEISRSADALGRRVRVHLHVDTGMTRNGARPDDAVALASAVASLPGLELVGVASHFATSDDDTAFAAKQHDRFAATVAHLGDAGYTFADVHVANSGGILNLPQAHHTVVRPGISLYGYHPSHVDQEASGLQPVLSLHSRVSTVTVVDAGTPVSYGSTWRSLHTTRIATLPIGYADGLMRILSGRLDVLIDGRRYPVVGRISMDETMIDVGTGVAVERGDDAVLIGRSGDEIITAWDLAEAAGTIPYEICTNISARVPRRNEGRDDHDALSRTSPTLSSTQ